MSRSRVVVLMSAVLLGSTALVSAQQIPKPPTGNPRFDAAVRKAVEYLKGKAGDLHDGHLSLVGYALLKAGVPASDPAVKAAIAGAKSRVVGGAYVPGTPRISQEHIYFGGVDAMLLEAGDPQGSRAELQAIATYLMREQRSHGSWDYPARGNDKSGDTSMAQYGVLGLWACQRAGIAVPPSVFDRALSWHLKAKNSDGGWPYHPRENVGPGQDGRSTSNMTYGATGSMAVCRLLIYPDYAPTGKKKKKPKKKKLFGVLEEKETDDTDGSQTKNPYEGFRPTLTTAGGTEASINGGLNWLSDRFRTSTESISSHKMYYYYAMERSLALNDVKVINGQDWYTVCGNVLVEAQGSDGSWGGGSGKEAAAAFGILFFVKSTAKILGKVYGKGLQVGDRGFDLSGGDPMSKDKKKKKLGPLDEMLARLDNLNVQGIQDVPEEDLSDLVEKILQTPRKELIGQMDMLKKLRDHKRGDVRSIVMFALGRSGDMRVAPILIDGLNDNDVGVLTEAHTALCYISRKPRGFEIEANLSAEVEGLEEKQMNDTVNAWRKKATTRWRAWYKRIRPYDERGDLWELGGAGSKKGSK